MAIEWGPWHRCEYCGELVDENADDTVRDDFGWYCGECHALALEEDAHQDDLVRERWRLP